MNFNNFIFLTDYNCIKGDTKHVHTIITYIFKGEQHI